MTSKQMRDAQDELQPDVEAIEEFLTECIGPGSDDGPALVQLTAIDPEDPDASPHTHTFDEAAEAAEWAMQKNAAMGVYVLAGEPGKKLRRRVRKKDVARLWHLFADLDPPKDMRQDPASLKAWRHEAVPKIEAVLDKHSIAAHIVSTGGGLALFAALDEPFEIEGDDEKRAYVEDLTARFHALFSSFCKVDGTHDTTRLMRLPGTWNFPSPKKLDVGREPALAEWIADDFGTNTLAIFEALPAVAKKVRGASSTGKRYGDPAYGRGYRPLTLDDALKAHKPLREWRGNGGKDSSSSADVWSLVQTVVNALLALERCAIDELDDHDARTNVYELCDAFIDRYEDRCKAVIEHLEGNPHGYEDKLSYDIDRAFSGGEPDRGPEEVKCERAIERLRSRLSAREDGEEKTTQTNKRKIVKPKESDAPDWATETQAAVKAALRELALSEIEHSDPMEFHKLLEHIASKASQHGVDLHAKVTPGSRTTLIFATYKAEKAAIKEDAKNERADSGIAFPHTDERDGLPRKDSVPNVAAWLEYYEHQIWFDEFADEVMHGKKPMDDSRMLTLKEAMHEDQFFAGTPLVKDGIQAVARKNQRHPVREYFDKVRDEWDGTKQLDMWLVDYCGAPNNKHWRAAGRLLMIAVVMRIRYPGAKWDNILALLGPEGFGKSKLCRALAIRDDWHLPGYQLSWSQKEIIENTAGIVIAEYEEMAGHSQKEQATLKAAASRGKDRARKAYGHFAETKKRTFVTIANANELEVLISKHGNRRFWPLQITKPIDVEGLDDVLDQLYGEAVHAQEAYLEKYGTDVELPKEHWAYFGELQEQHRVKSPIEDRVNKLMDGFDGGHMMACDLYTALEISTKDRYQAAEAEHAMKLCGWSKERVRMSEDHHPQRYFIKGNSVESCRIMCERNTIDGGFYLQYAHGGVHDHGGKSASRCA